MSVIARQYGLRRLAEKMTRRVRLLAGRPDNSPWILDARPAKRSAHVDFLFGLNYLSPNSRLVQMLHQSMSAYGLSFLLANNSNVEKVTREIESGWLRPHVYLDLSSYPGDSFDRLLRTAAEHGIYTVRDVRHTKWILKADAHEELEKAGVPVPPTVILRKDQPDRDLTSDELAKIGLQCVIKPSSGGAGKGVVIGAAPARDVIAKARDFDRTDDWLVQRRMTWGKIGQYDAYLRAYGVFGHRTLLWWQHDTGGSGGYRMMTWEDYERHNLHPVVRMIDRLIDLTNMDYFSVEVAMVKEDGDDRFCLIDYVNDQCDMDAAAHPKYAVPEAFSSFACHQLAEFVYRKKTGSLPIPQRGLFLV